MKHPMSTIAIVGVAVACGARSGPLLPEDAPHASPTAPQDASGGAAPDARASGDPPLPAPAADATLHDARDPSPQPDASTDSGGSCGKPNGWPGATDCCDGTFCGGKCFGQPGYRYCRCGVIKGGCPLPMACCGGGCKSPEHKSCMQ
jgi:hypothetical protein